MAPTEPPRRSPIHLVDTSGDLPDAEPTSAPARSGLRLRTIALAAVIAQTIDDFDPDQATPEIRLLRSQLALDEAAPDCARALRTYVRHPHSDDLPLIGLAADLDLTPFELLTVALGAAVEDDVIVGRALARVQAPVGGSRPTIGLLAAAFADLVEPGERPLNLLLAGAATRTGLLTVLGDGAPVPERAVCVPPALCLALGGHDGNWPGATVGDQGNVPLPPSIGELALRQALSFRSAERQALILRTGSPAEGRSVAALIAGAMRRRPVFLDGEPAAGLGPWLILRGLLPVFCLDPAPGERRQLSPIPGYSGPILAVAGPDGSVHLPGATVMSWTLPVPPAEERRQLWVAALGTELLADELAAHHRHGTGRIAQLGRLARRVGSVHGRTEPAKEDVVEAAWIGVEAGLDSLAQPLTDPIPDEALVMSPTLRNELETLLLRCRSRDDLVRGLGVSATARYSPGVRALFVGPSGTGKTLAAGWLATKLGLPIYRVDLASVTSKYIGETEKNLAQLLARAEQAEVILLFDEADSIFGKRTDVKDANDRFANAQTNYLLQRIESFEGIVLLTSNSRGRFDAAFSRRLDLIVEFPLPGPEERRAIWHSHLGKGHRLSPRDANQLAALADIGGGQVRNAVLTAAVRARAEARPIDYADIIEGLAAEYRKLGRQMPAGLSDRP